MTKNYNAVREVSYIEQAIREAVKGGWKEDGDIIVHDTWVEIDCTNGVFQVDLSDAFLDPEFWRCLGVARGWRMSTKSYYKSLGMGNGRPIYRGEIYEVNSWIYYMHQFIDHLAAEKPAESFFEQLLSSNK